MADTDDWAMKKALHLARVEYGLLGPSSYDMADDIASALRDARREGMESSGRILDIVFDGPPGAVPGRFVEVEDVHGRGVNAGEWIQRPNGYWALRIRALAAGGKAE